MSNVHISDHPLISHKLTLLRDISTDHRTFRELVQEIAILLCYEVTRELQLTHTQVQTPMGVASGSSVAETIGLVPVLRAGLGLVDGLTKLLPSSQVWHIGLYRDENTLKPVEYYNRLPQKPTVNIAIVLDPMLATGGSAAATVDILKRWGVGSIKFLGLVGAPEGIAHLQTRHPDVDIYLAALDDGLNDIGFIVPGLGDAGDRMFGTQGFH